MRRALILGITVMVALLFSTAALAAPFDDVLNRWKKTVTFTDRGDALTINAIYYSSEYIEATVQNEAEKNLWTANELEMHKYQLLKTLNLDEMIPIKLEFVNNGASLHMAPFGDQLWLWIGNKKYKPVDYDPRFNFKVEEKIEGMVYFPRFDEKTGKDLLEGQNRVKLEINRGISMTIRALAVDFIWDVANDDPARLFAGEAGSKLEMDRLIKRLAKLNKDKADYEEKIAAVIEEIDMIEARMAELQKQ